MKKYLIGFISLALFSTASFAQGATNSQRVSWVAPTTYADGITLIPTNTVITYNVYATMGTAPEVRSRSATPSTSMISTTLPVGQNNCYVITAMLDGGPESVRSAKACGVVTGPTSAPVTTVVVQSP